MKILIIFIGIFICAVFSQDDGLEILSVNVDGSLMENAKITTSATCGSDGSENYCRLVYEKAIQTQSLQESHVQCDICDDRNETKRHPIEYAKSDDDNLWWQSPSMAQGLQYQNVNVTIDLKQVYQIVYILLKMGDSPRPGNWVLERSLDGQTYMPWIFFAETPYSCYNLFQRQYSELRLTTNARPNSLEDDEMFCTTYYSQPKSLNSGEIIISLINGRNSLMLEEYPTVKSIPQKLINFLSARFIRFRFLKHLTLAADLMTHKGYLEKSIYNRYYYSLRNIEIGGKCICNNHADKCDKVITNGITVSRCNCKHNTCGSNCEICCPLFNQKPWKPVVSCEECNCNRKSKECVYNQTVDMSQMSTNKMGRMEGGGVCINCQENTEGINCEKCKKRFYRPWNVLATEQYPCKPCKCFGMGTVGDCLSNGEEIDNQKPGDCICKKGYTGDNCDICVVGYERYPNGECLPCPCAIDGSVTSSLYRCKPPCNCKVNVESSDECKSCKNGFFNLDPKNPEGCQACYCFGITNQCTSLNAHNLQIHDLTNWKLSTINGEKTAVPKISPLKYLVSENSYIDELFDRPTVYYWVAPQAFLGNWLTSYGTILQYIVKIELNSLSEGSQIDSPDVIIKCGNFRLFHSLSAEERRLQRKVHIFIKYPYWKIGKLKPQNETTKDEFLACLVNVESLMIKAKYYTNQNSIGLLNITLSRGDPQFAISQMPHIEKCICPPSFSGLSCESCDVGHRRVNNILLQGQCELCSCYGHSDKCDPVTGECKNCLHNTTGLHCDECLSGFHGDAKSKPIGSCKRCACPSFEMPMSDKCSTYSPGMYICHDCTNNTTGAHCERCMDGFYGNPLDTTACKKCKCNGNQDSCDPITGECRCSFDTMGSECEICKHGFYGDALNKTCTKCDCNFMGSKNQKCNKVSGQCVCQENFINRQCDTCAPGLFLKKGKCVNCLCETGGRIPSARFCNSTTGSCFCQDRINGDSCNKCIQGFYGFPNCKICQCSSHALSIDCDMKNGACECGSNVIGRNCNQCQDLFYWSNRTHCSPCNCGKGAITENCDMNTGKCTCSQNVINRDCGQCDYNYYGLGPAGCRKCPPCVNGQICNNDGKCICPPNTVGDLCEKCADNSWSYNATAGCKKCDCSTEGSASKTCDQVSGKCPCHESYKGIQCDECNAGYYGHPICKPCNCSKSGTQIGKLNQCHATSGQCECKENVMGQQCHDCKPGTFPSDGMYKGGCFSCFCFGVTNKCQPLLNHRVLESVTYEYHIFDEKDSFEMGKDHTVISLNPFHPKSFGWPLHLFRPIYIEVLNLFKSHDLSLFYRSVIMNASINCLSSKCGRENSIQTEVILESYNGLFELRYLVKHSASNVNNINIEFSEESANGQWIISKYKNDVLDKFISMSNGDVININVTRDIFMMALLNVTGFKIQLYSDKINPSVIKLKLLTHKTLQTTTNVGKPITAVETCNCNSLTTGNHCQNVVDGYFKEVLTLPDGIIGSGLRSGLRIKTNVKKCDCNGHSSTCDKMSGLCYNCANHTTGSKCHLCVEGFYGDTRFSGQCQPCQCPTDKYNFAKSCSKPTDSPLFKCHCQAGYSGLLCEKCAVGFYGNPIRGIPCKECGCNVQGSLSIACNRNGICDCAPGVLGSKCDQCSDNYAVENKKCQNCFTGCTKELLNRIDKFNNSLINMKWKSIPSNIDIKINKINVSTKAISDHLSSLYSFYKIKDEINNISVRFQKLQETTKIKYAEAQELKSKYNQALERLLLIFKDINETTSGTKQIGSSDDILNNATQFLDIMKNLINGMPNVSQAELFLLEVLKHVKELNNSIAKTENMMQTEKLINLSILKEKIVLANNINKDNQAYLVKLDGNNILYDLRIESIETEINNFVNLLKEISLKTARLVGDVEILENIRKKFQNKQEMTAKLITEIEMLMNSISNITSGKNKLFIPPLMKKHVEEQLDKSSKIIQNLTKEFKFLHNAEKAKEAYSNISRDISAVEVAINSTKAQLDNNKSTINLDKMLKKLNDSSFNKSIILQQKKIVDDQQEEFKNQYRNFVQNQKKLKENNEKLAFQISNQTFDIQPLKKNLSTLRDDQIAMQNSLVNSLNKSLSNFQIPKLGSDKEKSEIEINIRNVTDQYEEMANDTLIVHSRIRKLRDNIKILRDRLHKVKVIAELIHGAASRSSEPIRPIDRCVRHYVTYYLPKSNAFSLEFYMKPQFPDQPSLVLFGYDDSDVVPHAFAFTIERNNQYKFWYDYGQKFETLELIKPLTKDNYAGVMITWKLGKWQMNIKSITDTGTNQGIAQSELNRNILNSIRIGPKTNVFMGGFPSSKLLGKLKFEGNLVPYLRENYENNYFKGCIFGVRLMNSEFGLQDIEAIEEECKKVISVDHLLLQSFTCKINRNSSILFSELNMENVNKFKTSMKRQKRSSDIDFDLHFTGNGYALINTSKIKTGECKYKLNKLLSIATLPVQIMNTETFQLIAVFANHVKNLGFVVGVKNANYYFGYWKEGFEKEMVQLQNATEHFKWYIFKLKVENNNEELFGIDDICDPNSFIYLGDIPSFEMKLIDQLKKLKIPNFGFTGKMKLLVGQTNKFQILATRFINIIYLPSERVQDTKFQSVFISSEVTRSIEMKKDLYGDVLQYGFGFTVDFLDRRILKSLTLLTIETNLGKISMEISKDLVFILKFLTYEIKKELQSTNDLKGWGAHYIVVFFSSNSQSSILATMTVDNEPIVSQDISTDESARQINRITIGSDSNIQHPYYIYNLFLGQKLVDFNDASFLPPGTFLKQRPMQLQSGDDQFASSEINKPILRPGDYPVNSGWFDGISNSFISLTSGIIDQYRQTTNNQISFMVRSASRRPELLLSLNFGPDKTLNVATANGQLILYDSMTTWAERFPIQLIDEEWHTLTFIASVQNPERGLRVYQDNHSFNFPFAPIGFVYPRLIDIGGFVGPNPRLSYNNEKFEVQHFTGCIDAFKINNQTVRLSKRGSENNVDTCPRVLEFLNTGGHILDSYKNIYNGEGFIKLKMGDYSVLNTENTYVLKFKFKYIGSVHEQGSILVIGETSKFCSLTLKEEKIFLHYGNFKDIEFQHDSIKISKEKWYKLEFIVYHNVGMFTVCKMIVDDNEVAITLFDNQMFSEGFKKPDIYFGGHPNLLLSQRNKLTQVDKNFVGCLSDLAFFANKVSVTCSLEKSKHLIGGRCSVDKTTYFL